MFDPLGGTDDLGRSPSADGSFRVEMVALTPGAQQVALSFSRRLDARSRRRR